jgi:Flp pilus assembly protein TadG
MNAAMKRAGRQKGALAVEFAILAIPLLVILTGITEYGRALYYYNSLAKAVRDGARLLSTQTPTDPGYATLVSGVTCTVVYGNNACTGDPLIPGLTTAMVSICDPVSCPATHAAVPTGTGVANLVTVQVGGQAGYTFGSMAPFMPAAFGVPSLNFAPIAATMRQVL